MKEKRECKIIQDLLPNYVEKLTKEETNVFIEEHLKECKECDRILENMQKDLNIDHITKDEKAVKYFKKYRNELKILKATILIILVIALGIMTYYYFYFRDAYFSAATQLVEVFSEGIYPDTFYATIEEISDSEVYGIKTIKIKGLNINDINHRGEFYFYVPLDNIPDNFKIKWSSMDIEFEQLEVGQTIAVYAYGDILESEPELLSNVKMLVILDDKL